MGLAKAMLSVIQKRVKKEGTYTLLAWVHCCEEITEQSGNPLSRIDYSLGVFVRSDSMSIGDSEAEELFGILDSRSSIMVHVDSETVHSSGLPLGNLLAEQFVAFAFFKRKPFFEMRAEMKAVVDEYKKSKKQMNEIKFHLLQEDRFVSEMEFHFKDLHDHLNDFLSSKSMNRKKLDTLVDSLVDSFIKMQCIYYIQTLNNLGMFLPYQLMFDQKSFYLMFGIIKLMDFGSSFNENSEVIEDWPRHVENSTDYVTLKQELGLA